MKEKKYEDIGYSYIVFQQHINGYIKCFLDGNKEYTFFDKRNIEFIKEHLNLDKYELREKLMIIFYELYQIGIEEKLYKEVAINV